MTSDSLNPFQAPNLDPQTPPPAAHDFLDCVIDSSNAIVAEGALTADDVGHAFVLYHKRGRLRRYVVWILLAALGVYLIVINVNRGAATTGTTVLGLFLVFLALANLIKDPFQHRAGAKQWRKTPALQEPSRLIFTSNRVQIATSDVSLTSRWNHYGNYQATDTHLLLFPQATPTRFTIVARRNLKSDADWAPLLAMVGANLSPR